VDVDDVAFHFIGKPAELLLGDAVCVDGADDWHKVDFKRQKNDRQKNGLSQRFFVYHLFVFNSGRL
jgi:hypothetical protein